MSCDSFGIVERVSEITLVGRKISILEKLVPDQNTFCAQKNAHTA